MNRSTQLIAFGVALMALLAPGAQAYEYPPIEEDVAAHVETCVSEAASGGDGTACIGVIFDACEGSAGSTYSMSACFRQETDFWQSMIEQTLPDVLLAFDEDDRRTMMDEPLSASLKKSQDAWSAYMTAQCGFEYDQMGAGSLRNLTGGACLRNLTAERAIFLRGLVPQS